MAAFVFQFCQCFSCTAQQISVCVNQSKINVHENVGILHFAESAYANSATFSSSYFSMRTPRTSIMEASGWFSSSPTSSTRRSSCFTSWRYSRSLCGTRNAGSTCGQTANALFSCAVDMLFSRFPLARVVFGVGQHRANIHFPAIIVNGRNEASLVAADVEHGQPADLIRVR